MSDLDEHSEAAALRERLIDAMNRRDVGAFVACFAEDYDSEQPVHPDRHFRGRSQVEVNWSRMFAAVPDFPLQVIRSVVSADELWMEWHWTGTRPDQSELDVRGVAILGVRGERIAWGRLYVEDVDRAGRGIDAAVSELAKSDESARE